MNRNSFLRQQLAWMRIETVHALIAVCILHFTYALEVGIDICACQPSVYELTIRSGLTCQDNDVRENPGIQETACLVETRLSDEVSVTDFVPATVSEIQILELDQEQEVIGQTVFTDGPYFEGDSVQYTSIVESNPKNIDPSSLPLGFQVTILGNNANNEPIVNTWGILYNNDCGVFPLLEEGQTIGWTEFVS